MRRAKRSGGPIFVVPSFGAVGWERVLIVCACLLYATMALAQAGKTSTPQPPATLSQGQRTVAERPANANTKYSLAVDNDGRVLLLFIGEKGAIEESVLVGWEACSNDFPFKSELPADEALVGLRRVTARDKWRIWVTMTVRFDKTPKPGQEFSLVNVLYFFRETAAGSKTSLLHESLPEVSDFVVDDINADGNTDVALQYTPADSRFTSKLALWEIMPDGNVRAVSLDDLMADLPQAAQLEIGLGDYQRGEEVFYIEQRAEVIGGLIRIVHNSYNWDPDTNTYTLREVIKSEERPIK